MRLSRRILFTVAAVMAALFLDPPALALANRVFVSQRSGNDANSCDNILTPCQTFAGAVVQLNPGGEAIALDSGGYGPVTITQAVTIEAAPGITAFIHPPSGDAITINAGASDTVILRGLTLNGGMGNGIKVNTVGQLFVERCTITNFANFGVGVYFLATGGTLFMNDDDVGKCAFGVQVSSSVGGVSAIIRRSVFSGNAYGVWAGDGSNVAVTDCTAAGNSSYGFLLQTTIHGSPFMMLDHVQAVSNGTGIAVLSVGAGTPFLQFAYSLVTQNEIGVLVGASGNGAGSSPGTSAVYQNTTDISGTLDTVESLK